ncbi:branched-chain amino acid aminotransferase [Vicingaceae bacterium]|nr:branched-chain amino acid aminotransferase [Vicingaceae bacterium]
MKHSTFPVQKIATSKLSSINFDNLKFGRDFSDHMLLAEYNDEVWKTPQILPYQPLELFPAASVFHYGQAIFEGLKAHKNDAGEVFIFRADENFKRLNSSAARMSMPEIPEDIFMDGLMQLIELDKDWIPVGDGMSLYLRPFMIADDPFLGVKPSGSYKFMIITSPSASYYSGAVKVKIESHYSRAAVGGVGAAKAAGNYAASLLPAKKAQEEGYDQLIWTDAKNHQYLEESGTMNLMLVKGKKVLTPPLDSKTILPGITRKSILQLAEEWGYEVMERPITVTELVEGIEDNSISELFGVGTAATIAPISVVGYKDNQLQLPDYTKWEFSTKVKQYLEELKTGKVKDTHNWIETL